jgi:FKBP-type peptidyl-prolyl cis-trans isomerase
VNYCNAITIPGRDATLEVRSSYVPAKCTKKQTVKKDSQILMLYQGRAREARRSNDAAEVVFDSVTDWTKAAPIQLGKGRPNVPKGWDIALEGMCEGEKATLVVPPALGFGRGAGGPLAAHANLRLVYEVEVGRTRP